MDTTCMSMLVAQRLFVVMLYEKLAMQERKQLAQQKIYSVKTNDAANIQEQKKNLNEAQS